MREAAFVAVGACSACPFRTTCHAPRQRVQDAAGIGRHTSCPFYGDLARAFGFRRDQAPAGLRWPWTVAGLTTGPATVPSRLRTLLRAAWGRG